jgi:hypothetical protein
MTRAEQDRRKRQMNRRIREVLAVRRTLAASDLGSSAREFEGRASKIDANPPEAAT